MSADSQLNESSMKSDVDERKDAWEHSNIRHKFLVLSGKGGVGKSTVAVNTAVYLAMNGFKTGLLDIDLHGPSLPTMLNIDKADIVKDEEGIIPVTLKALNGLKVMSIGFFLPEQDSPVIWRGPRKTGMIKEFVENVVWGDLDYLIVDSPPGTGDEPLSAIQLIKNPDGALIVTTPQQLSAVDVSKSINFCRQLQLPILGLIENMSGFICPHCREVINIFPQGSGRELADKYRIPFIGSIPVDPEFGVSGDSGVPYVRKYFGTDKIGVFAYIAGMLLKIQGEEK